MSGGNPVLVRDSADHWFRRIRCAARGTAGPPRTRLPRTRARAGPAACRGLRMRAYVPGPRSPEDPRSGSLAALKNARWSRATIARGFGLGWDSTFPPMTTAGSRAAFTDGTPCRAENGSRWPSCCGSVSPVRDLQPLPTVLAAGGVPSPAGGKDLPCPGKRGHGFTAAENLLVRSAIDPGPRSAAELAQASSHRPHSAQRRLL